MKNNFIHLISVKSNRIGDLLARNLLRTFFSEISSRVIWRRFLDEEEYDSFLFYQIKYDWRFPRKKFSEDPPFREFFWGHLMMIY